jgi:hypothetical protein
MASLPDDGGVQAMQDVLYDILANGMDAERGDVPMQEVERFLFEHARTPKSRDEFHAFFALHGLSVRTRLAAAGNGLVLPPLQRVALPEDRGMPASVPVELAAAVAPRMPELQPPPEPALIEPPRARGRTLALWTALTCVTALLAAGGYYGYKTVTELRGELARTAQDGRDNQQALKALRDQAVGLESSVQATGELVQRMDQKSDLIINTLLPPEPTKTSRKRK